MDLIIQLHHWQQHLAANSNTKSTSHTSPCDWKIFSFVPDGTSYFDIRRHIRRHTALAMAATHRALHSLPNLTEEVKNRIQYHLEVE